MVEPNPYHLDPQEQLTDADMPPDPPPQPTSPPLTALKRLNGMMGRIRNLRADIAVYDAIHDAEIERLMARREKAVGPWERRLARLERAVDQFAVNSMFEFGEISHRFPNGDISSNPVLTKIFKDDAVIADADWGRNVLDPDAVRREPKVEMRKLRECLDELVEAGYVARLVARPPADDDDDMMDAVVVDESEGWLEPIPDGYIGVWFWTDSGENMYGFEHGEILEGVRWEPNGTMSSGRNFRMILA